MFGENGRKNDRRRDTARRGAREASENAGPAQNESATPDRRNRNVPRARGGERAAVSRAAEWSKAGQPAAAMRSAHFARRPRVLSAHDEGTTRAERAAANARNPTVTRRSGGELELAWRPRAGARRLRTTAGPGRAEPRRAAPSPQPRASRRAHPTHAQAASRNCPAISPSDRCGANISISRYA
ncbi:hypothetical protein WS86_10065 [Burkholderia savannae]|nr:hypothetical protein WS86_10065 [Burkholderia savannae]